MISRHHVTVLGTVRQLRDATLHLLGVAMHPNLFTLRRTLRALGELLEVPGSISVLLESKSETTQHRDENSSNVEAQHSIGEPSANCSIHTC